MVIHIEKKKFASQAAYHLGGWERQQEVCGLKWSIGGGLQEGRGVRQRERFYLKEVQTGCTPWVQRKPISFK